MVNSIEIAPPKLRAFKVFQMMNIEVAWTLYPIGKRRYHELEYTGPGNIPA